jgi:quinohemoprotein ethanol dehydrogenase
VLPPAPPPPPAPVLNPPPSTASKETIEAGHQKFSSHCAMCHEPPAANRSVFPDLRYSPMLGSADAFSAVVLDGVLQANGMASFKGRLTADEVQSVRAYLIERANQAKNSPTPPR